MKRKKYAAMALIAALIAAALSCQTVSNVISEPSLSLESVSLTGINFSGADMLARVRIQNDNPFAIPFPEMGWKLFMAGSDFLSGTVKNNTKIEARASSVVELPFTVSYEGLYKTLSTLLDADEAPYRLDLAARFPLPVLESKTFTTSFNGVLPLLKAPALSFSGVKVSSAGASKVELVLTWLVDNKNAFPVNLDKLDYSLAVNNNPWVSGSAPRRLSLPARRSTPVPVTVSVNALSVVQEIAALAAGGQTVNYTCGGEAALSPQLAGVPESAAALKLPFNYSGTTRLR